MKLALEVSPAIFFHNGLHQAVKDACATVRYTYCDLMSAEYVNFSELIQTHDAGTNRTRNKSYKSRWPARATTWPQIYRNTSYKSILPMRNVGTNRTDPCCPHTLPEAALRSFLFFRPSFPSAVNLQKTSSLGSRV